MNVVGFIVLTNGRRGDEYTLQLAEISEIINTRDGSQVIMRNGNHYHVSETPQQIQEMIRTIRAGQ